MNSTPFRGFRSLLLVFLLGCASTPSALADVDASAPLHRDQTLSLLLAMGVRDQTGPALERQLAKLKEQDPDVPDEFWQKQFERHMEAKLMLNGMAAAIEERFSAQEIAALLDFYQSSIGKRMVGLRIDLGQVARKLGQQLGAQFSAEIRTELEKQGYPK